MATRICGCVTKHGHALCLPRRYEPRRTLPIDFGPQAGCHREGVQPVGCQYYDPSATLTARFPAAAGPDEVFSVWLGGTVRATPDQVPGPYSGFATASVAYTANE